MKSLLLAFVSILLLTSILHASAIEAITTANGLFYQETAGLRGPVRTPPLDDPAQLWTRNLATGIFYSTAITTANYAYTGSGLNDPREAAKYDIFGDGTPLDPLVGRDWEVACAPDGGFWAAVDRNDSNLCTLYLLNDQAGTPVWTYDLGFGAVAGVDGMQFSADGHLLVLYMTRAPDFTPRLLAWDLNLPDNVPWVDYEFPQGEGLYARALAISSDGSVVAGTADQYCHVIETDGVVVRDVVDFQASTDALALSADGAFLMSGFQAVRLYHWNGVEYEQRWQVGLGSRFVGQLLISPDTTYAVSCWYWNTYDRNYIRVHSMELGWAIWSYSYNLGSGNQDLPVDADMSSNGNWFAVGSWGDAGSNNGEAVVFSRWYPTPYYELDMAGSCFSLDLSADAHYLIAAGKHVHANQFGNGGDAYVVDLDLPPAEPVPRVDALVPYDDEIVCFCEDTVEFVVRLWNLGYEPFDVNEFNIIALPDDGGNFEVEDSLYLHIVHPGDTLEVAIKYSHCLTGFPINSGPYELQWIFSNEDTLVTTVEGFNVQFCTGADDNVNLMPQVFSLAAYPNPFNSTTTFSYTLPNASNVHLTITNILGRVVDELHSGSLTAGSHQFSWNASDLPSGIYFARLDSRFGSRLQKLVLLK